MPILSGLSRLRAVVCNCASVLVCCVALSVDCPSGDVYCQQDKAGFEAIVRLFSQIDDDSDGNLDRTESDEVCAIEFNTQKLDLLLTYCGMYS